MCSVACFISAVSIRVLIILKPNEFLYGSSLYVDEIENKLFYLFWGRSVGTYYRSKASLYVTIIWSHMDLSVFAPATITWSDVELSLVCRRMWRIGSDGWGTVYPQNSVWGSCIKTCRKELPRVWSSFNKEYVFDRSETVAFCIRRIKKR